MGTSRVAASYPPRRKTTSSFVRVAGAANTRPAMVASGIAARHCKRVRRCICAPPLPASPVHEFWGSQQEEIPFLWRVGLIEGLARGAAERLVQRLVVERVGQLRECWALGRLGTVGLEQPSVT